MAKNTEKMGSDVTVKCQACGEHATQLEKHHIIPKSRGGSDDSGNLIELCIECHGRAHDISFSRLVKDGQLSAKEKRQAATRWLRDDKNRDWVVSQVMRIYDCDRHNGIFLTIAIESNVISTQDLMSWQSQGVLKMGSMTFYADGKKEDGETESD